ncbi:uncharacterized, partial [Tachysurus ichikawai]
RGVRGVHAVLIISLSSASTTRPATQERDTARNDYKTIAATFPLAVYSLDSDCERSAARRHGYTLELRTTDAGAGGAAKARSNRKNEADELLRRKPKPTTLLLKTSATPRRVSEASHHERKTLLLR